MSGKSKEEIAFEILSKLKGVGVWGENNRTEILDMYAECLEATSGLRELKGKTPSALKLSGQSTHAATPASAPVAPPQAAAPRQAVPPQQAPAQPHVQSPPVQQPQVRQQQQMVQQAYQQQPPVAR